jgi:hypothetical protein
MEPSDVPILMEQAFEGLFRHVDGLEKLWNALLSRPDKKLAATKVVDGTMTIQLGEYEFVLPALGIRG